MGRMGTPPKLPEIRTEDTNAVLKNKLYLLFYLKNLYFYYLQRILVKKL